MIKIRTIFFIVSREYYRFKESNNKAITEYLKSSEQKRSDCCYILIIYFAHYFDKCFLKHYC